MAAQERIYLYGIGRIQRSRRALPHPDLPANDFSNWRAFPRSILRGVAAYVRARLTESDPENAGGMLIPGNIPYPTKCRNCAQTTLTLRQYAALPEEKTRARHLSCKDCGQRIPVGEDIQELPKRIEQPPISAAIPGRNEPRTRQQCLHADCPLAGTPHPLGLFSSKNIRPPPGVSLSRQVLKLDRSQPLANMKNFWGGNTFVPLIVKDRFDDIRKQEFSYTDRHNFKITNANLLKRLDQDRKDVINFRRYHCFYTEDGEDLLPQHLHAFVVLPGSPEWFSRYVDVLPRVALDELAEDDRACPICKGEYGTETGVDDDEAELPVRLSCGAPQITASGKQILGHVFGDACLKILLTSKEDGGAGYKHCIMCRAQLFSG